MNVNRLIKNLGGEKIETVKQRKARQKREQEALRQNTEKFFARTEGQEGIHRLCNHLNIRRIR